MADSITEDHARMYREMSRHLDNIGGMVSGLGEHGLANTLWARATDLAECARDHKPYIPTRDRVNVDS